MKYSAVLVTAASVVAALPQAPAVRSGHQSRVNFRDNKFSDKSTNWAGVVQIGNGFNHVEGVVTVPAVSGAADAAVSAWVGIDGDTYGKAILQTGVSFYGDGSFDAWYEWLPDYAYSFPNFPIKVGDQIKLSVDATSLSTGVATLQNLNTGTKVSHTFKHVLASLGEKNAEWIVEDFESGGSQVELAKFDTITFTKAVASGTSGSITPKGGDVIDLWTQDQEVLTHVTIQNNDVNVKYIGN